MDAPWQVDVEPEVKEWLGGLTGDEYLHADHAVSRLVDAPTTLGHPYTSHLGDGLRELRFHLGQDGLAVRITYWLAPDQRIVLLTVFRKTKQRETAQVDRARLVIKACQEQGPAHEPGHDPAWTRNVTKGDLR
ncbi:type II toxin-antitoxin system RelE/ParE family toxin [Streptomyces sp. KLOTTS4A1]|uniref:type II toxin-antitoxin system RelE/ParE family toxin n=1 Tax=Streptomyces sp. KLOTTS4A1 TaxID=3390996 RepID=UPI0039F48BE6